MNIDIFIPARLDSKRLPKKHLEKINGFSLIEILVNRLNSLKNIRNIIICITDEKSDDELAKFLEEKNIKYFRGNKKNILKRFLDASKKFGTDIILDIEGDKIYTDPEFVKIVSDEIIDGEYDFIIGNDDENVFNPNSHFVHGVIPTAIRVSCLEKIFNEINNQNTETGYKEIFIKNPQVKKKFILISDIKQIPDILRLTIDYPEDLIFAKKMFKKLDKDFSYLDILEIVRQNPEFLDIIKEINKKWIENYNKVSKYL